MGDNRVSGTRSSSTPSSNSVSTESTEGATASERAEESDGAAQSDGPTSEEVLEGARESAEWLDEATGGALSDVGGAISDAARAAGDAAASVGETTVQSLRAEQASAEGTSEGDFRDMEVAQQLGDAISDADSVDELASASDVALEDLDYSDLRTLRERPEKLESFVRGQVQKRADSDGGLSANPATGFYDSESERVDRATSGVMEEIDAKLMEKVKSGIENRLEGTVETALDSSRAINHSEGSRRRFLANLAGELDSREQVEKALREQGLSAGDASTIGASLETLQNDPSKLEAFLDPEQSSPAFDRASKTLEEHYDESIDELETFEERVSTDANNPYHAGRELLTDPNYEAARKQTFAAGGFDPDLADGPTGEDYDSGMNALIQEEMAAAQTSKETEEDVITGINVATALVTAPISGVAAGAAMSVAGSAVEINQAEQNLHATEGAAEADLVDESDVESARAQRDAAVAAAVLDLAMTGAGEKVDAYKNLTERMGDFDSTLVEEGAKEGFANTFSEVDERLRQKFED